MAMAIPMPSAGSVPEPSSSIMTKLSLSASLSTSRTFLIWAEKVDKFSEIFWPSPISQRYELFMQISASRQVTCSPHWAIMQFSMTVFMATVFPPVFGPVITMPRVSTPISNCRGILIFLSINGCLADINAIFRSVFKEGSTPSKSMLSFPLEKIKSSFSI